MQRLRGPSCESLEPSGTRRLKRRAPPEEEDAPRAASPLLQFGDQCSPGPHAAAPAAPLPPYGAFMLQHTHRGGEDAWSSGTVSVGGQHASSSPAPVALFCVYDGHSGAGAAHQSLRTLPAHFQAALKQRRQAAAAAPDGDAAAVRAALMQAFEATDEGLRHMPLGHASSGCTATVAAVTATHLHLAWAGDSRAAVLGGGQVLMETHDHRADREDEQERIAAAGGRVFRNSGMRVMGVLATTRAIGDHDLQPYGVIPTPDVVSLPRSVQQEFLVVATDGLWDVMSAKDVYDYATKAHAKVAEKHAARPPPSGVCCACQAAGVAARALAHCARKQRGSRDDITVLLVNLRAPCGCSAAAPHRAGGSSLAAKPAAARQPPRRGATAPAAAGGRPEGPQPTTAAAAGVSQRGGGAEPSPAPAPAGPAAAAARSAGAMRPPSPLAGGGGEAARRSPSQRVSDLVLSSPFAGLLGGGLARRPQQQLQQLLQQQQQGARPGSGGGQPHGSEAAAAVAPAEVASKAEARAEGNLAGALQHSLGLALSASRSCGLLGAGSVGSAELPLTVTG